MGKLKGYVTFTDPNSGESKTFGPNDELPEWADTSPDHIELDDGSSDDDPDQDDVLVAGPGQSAPPVETDAEKAERRKKADRDRKAAQRAADKKTADDAAAVKAAEEAEATRAAEAEEAARKAAEGGGS